MGSKDHNGHTALHWSCSEGRPDVVELILENSDARKIYLNEKDDSGRTALHLACKQGRVEVVEKLFEKAQELNIDLNATGKNYLKNKIDDILGYSGAPSKL